MKKILPVIIILLFTTAGYGQTVLINDTFEILGEWQPVSGSWVVRKNTLVQTNANERITHIYRKVKQSGVMIYEFDLYYIDGLDDRDGGFGIHILIDRPSYIRSWGNNSSYLLWLTYDVEAYKKDLFFAQVYKSRGPTSMHLFMMQKGDEFPIPAEIIDPAVFKMETDIKHMIPIRLLVDTATGKGRFYNPNDPEYFFPVDFGVPLMDGMYVSIRTNSMAIGIDNFKVSRVGE